MFMEQMDTETKSIVGIRWINIIQAFTYNIGKTLTVATYTFMERLDSLANIIMINTEPVELTN